jgi:hypothetical protein
MVTKIIAIFPGRFQPFGLHHKAAFNWLQKKFGATNTYIATSDKVDLPKSPLNFQEKQSIIKLHGITNVIQTKNPYKVEELLNKFNPETTAVVFMVGDKDMREDPRFKIGKLKSGKDSYFQIYDSTKELKGYNEHGYLIVAPHIKINVPGYKEMSGTELRKFLSTNPSPDAFKNIMGFWDSKVSNMLINKMKTNKTESKLFSKSWWSDNLFEDILQTNTTLDMGYQLLMCGGAGGHMKHPHELESVNTGTDLIKVFDKSIKYLQKQPGAVKIDGVNASIRLVNLNGKQQFVLDRGSNKPLDVKGITTDDLEDRFGKGHGMISIGGKVLQLFNSALPNIKIPLKKLGLLNNPNILLNLEFVEGSTNVLKYDSNFIAIHGLLEIAQSTATKRTTKEISYSKATMEELVNALNAIASKFNFQVYGEVPATFLSTPNLNSVLNKTVKIKRSAGEVVTKTLKNWLSDLVIPDYSTKIEWGGKKLSPVSKQVFSDVTSGVVVSKMTNDNDDDTDLAISGAITYLATMLLGDEILNNMDSPMGKLSNHEGIVIRDNSIAPVAFKITGKFILGGLQSKFR